LQTDRVDADDYSFTPFLSGVPRVGLLASRAKVGVPLQAAAGQATAVKLQTNRKRPFTIIKGKLLENDREHTF